MLLAKHIGSCLARDKSGYCGSSPRTVPTSGPGGEHLTSGHLGGSALQQQLPALLAHVAVILQEPGETEGAGCRGSRGADGQERAGKGRPPRQGTGGWRGWSHPWGRGVSTEPCPPGTDRCWRPRSDSQRVHSRPAVIHSAGGRDRLQWKCHLAEAQRRAVSQGPGQAWGGAQREQRC